MLIPVSDICKRWELSPQTILHVGAHAGEELEEYERHLWGIDRVLWIEALPDLAAQLADFLKSRKHHRVINAVAWHTCEPAQFFRTSNTQSSSILKLKGHLAEYPDIVETDSFEVQTTRLDDVLRSDPIHDLGIEFINLDVQGAELQALMGLGHMLTQASSVYSEVNLAELYVGCTTFVPLNNFLAKNGFTVVDIRMTNARWGDALWLRSDRLTCWARTWRRAIVYSRIVESWVRFYLRGLPRIFRRSASLTMAVRSIRARRSNSADC